ncbi:hypothetical protein [Legionella hackeliae]|uniref:Uncharacterized protein n=1 Tax=Legionella hackeliae TaxID=449 RepID=A0A0A8UW40_LEGHA|nr:hypothetical protein [Legionella hackeliae]KTD09692.1 hypothetical protein Lhac_2060 [Legionella hackeliae]CEK10984.1 membrane protein of unknown function [Legionella hackeliae]STX47724.1 Uncharacterised protein [Legionella hackeliae]
MIPLIVILYMLLASIFPLSSYLLSLSFFGVTHIFYELSYIYKHLAHKLPRAFIILVVGALLLLLMIKTIAIFLSIPYSLLLIIEFSFILILMTIACYFKTTFLTVLILLLFMVGIIVNPVILFMCLAFLHNLTPWGFLVAENAAHKAWIVFIICPLIVFFMSLFLAIDPGFYSLSKVNLYLSHYLVTEHINAFMFACFATAVYLQLIHYHYVIKILPSFCKTPIKLPGVVIGVFLIMGLIFLCNFQESKKFYSLIAMFHAYLEIPLLLYCLPRKENKLNSAVLLD